LAKAAAHCDLWTKSCCDRNKAIWKSVQKCSCENDTRIAGQGEGLVGCVSLFKKEVEQSRIPRPSGLNRLKRGTQIINDVDLLEVTLSC